MSTIYTILDEKISYISIFSSIFFIIIFVFLSKYLVKGKMRLIINSLIIIVNLYSIYLDTFYLYKLKNLYKSGEYKIVTGYIKNYKPEIYKKQVESFKVNDIVFELSKDYLHKGFNRTDILYNDLLVKIYYTKEGNKNIIIRVDILRN